MSFPIRIPPLIGHLAAYGASEVASKASRLLVVIAVARALDSAEIGLAAGALALSDILKSLTENGVNQRIIAARDADLAAISKAAHRIFWAWGLGLFLVQAGLGAISYLLNGDALIFAMIVILAAEYLFMPAGLVQAALAMRAGKMRQTAAIAGGQVVGANLITVALVFVWPSPLALVLPRVLAAPIWLVAMRRLHPWRADPRVAAAPLSPFLQFGLPVLGVEIVKALRLHADKLLVGWLLGAEALGFYFMVFNAGLGLASSFAMAFATVLFPHLSTAPDRLSALRQAMLVGVGLIAPAVVLQSLLAPIYVPILFGTGWEGASDVVSILCLAAIPGIVWTAAAGWLRAEGRPGTEFSVTVVQTAALVANTILMAPFGVSAIAVGYLIVATITQIGAAIPAIRAAFSPTLRPV